MTEDSIRVSEDTKDALEDIKENYYTHTTLTYSESIDVLVAEYNESTDGAEEKNSEVTRTSAGGDEQSSEDDDFQKEGLTAEERAAQFRQ